MNIFAADCCVYVACQMYGRDKSDMVERANYVRDVLHLYGLKTISPVLEEAVKKEHTKLINRNTNQVKTFWKHDKYLIRRVAHVVLLDQAENKSFGMEREYCLNRGVLWKPTVTVVSKGVPCSVIEMEDDAVFSSVHAAAAHISHHWLTRRQRWVWRAKMLNRSFLKWVWYQILAWR